MGALAQRVGTGSENVILVHASLVHVNSARRPESHVNLAGEADVWMQSIC
jgi:hypothetical protein